MKILAFGNLISVTQENLYNKGRIGRHNLDSFPRIEIIGSIFI